MGKIVMAPSRIEIHDGRTGFEPSPKQELLLRAALSTGDSAVNAWRKWRRLVDPDLHHLDPDSFGLIPLLFGNLSSLGVSDPMMDRFRGIFRRAWYQNQTLIHGSAGLIKALQSAGMEFLVLDGLPLALTYYQALGFRPLEGVDILVSAGQAEKVIHVLNSLGWKPSSVRTEKLMPAQFEIRQALNFNKSPSLSCVLHGGIISGDSAPSDNDLFWEAAKPLQVGRIRARTLGATDQLLSTCVRGVSRSWSLQTRWIADAVMILRAEGERIDWERLAFLAQRHRVSLLTRSALSYLRHFLDVPIPGEVLRRLGNVPTSEPERRMFAAAVHRNRFIGLLEYSRLRYRAYIAECRKTNRPPAVSGFLDYVRLWCGHESRWRTLRWAVSTSVRSIRRKS